MPNKKLIFIIVITALIFLGLGFYLNPFLFTPTFEPPELIDWQEKLAVWEQAQEDYELLWFAYNFPGQVTETKDNIIYIKGEMLDLEGGTIYREVAVTEDTEIILREREDFIRDEEELEQREREQIRQLCDQMQAIDWDPAVSIWEVFEPEEPELMPSLTAKEITIEQIRPGDRILATSQENIAANIRFEANVIYIDRD